MGFAGGGGTSITTTTAVSELAYLGQNAGEPLASYDIIFLDGNFWKKANSYTAARARPPFGIASGSPASGASLDVWARAIVSNGVWSGTLTSGNRVFLASGNALSGGVITMTPPAGSGDTVIVLGRAVTVTAMEFRPEPAITLAQ